MEQFRFCWDFPTAAEICVVFGAAESNNELLAFRSPERYFLSQNASFELPRDKIGGLSCGCVKVIKDTFINLYN